MNLFRNRLMTTGISGKVPEWRIATLFLCFFVTFFVSLPLCFFVTYYWCPRSQSFSREKPVIDFAMGLSW